MSFFIAAVATSIAGLVLGLGWLVAGTLVLKRWGVEASNESLLVGRRLGAVYLAIALLLFLSRSAPASDLRSAISIGMVAALTLLAALGLFVCADPNLSHRADRILSRGWKPTF